jgi:hypothetical protein
VDHLCRECHELDAANALDRIQKHQPPASAAVPTQISPDATTSRNTLVEPPTQSLPPIV